MSTGTWDYDGPDPNKPEQWNNNTSDGLGLAGPVPSAFGGPNGEPVPPDPNEPATGSGSGNGPYGTGHPQRPQTAGRLRCSGVTASSGSSGSGVDASAFGGADGAAVPADPAAATN